MNLHQLGKLLLQGVCEGVHVLAGVLDAKADAEGAFGLFRRQSKSKERRGDLFGVGGASRALRHADSVRRQGVEHGLALDIGQGDIQNVWRATACGKIDL